MAKVDVIRHYSQATRTLMQSFLERHNHRLEVFRDSGRVYLGVRATLEEIDLREETVKARADMYIPLSDLPRLVEALTALGVTPAAAVDDRRFVPVEGEGTRARIPDIVTDQGAAPKQGCYSRTEDGEVHGFRGGTVFVEVQTPKKGHNGWSNQPVMEAYELHLGMNGTPIAAGGATMPDGYGFVIAFNDQQAGNLLRRLMLLQGRLQYTIHGEGPNTLFELAVDGKPHQARKNFTRVEY